VKLGELHRTGIGSTRVVTRRAVVLAEIMPTPLAARYGLASDLAMSEEFCCERGFRNLTS
jgi:hypothetical protein